MEPDRDIVERLSPRAMVTFLVHLLKACFRSHHGEMAPDFALVLPKDGVVLDVGAHAGQFAKLFARIAPQGTIWAVEPGSYAFAILRRAMAVNRLGNVRLARLGFGDTPGTFELSMPVKKSGSLGFGRSQIGEGSAVDGRRYLRERVEISTVDAFVAEHAITRLDLLKADIEGYEMRMLAGARKTLESLRPAVFLEVVDSFLAQAGDSAADLWAMMTGLGYAGFALTGEGRLRPVDPGTQGDIVFLPSGHPAISAA